MGGEELNLGRRYCHQRKMLINHLDAVTILGIGGGAALFPVSRVTDGTWKRENSGGGGERGGKVLLSVGNVSSTGTVRA